MRPNCHRKSMLRYIHIIVAVLALLIAKALAAENETGVPESPRLQALARALAKGEAQATETFWHEVERAHTPLIEPLSEGSGDMLVTFLWRTAPDEKLATVSVYGEFGDTGHPLPTVGRLTRLGESDVWFRTYRMSDRARFSYSLVWPLGRTPDRDPGATFVDGDLVYEIDHDPRNPKSYASAWADVVDGRWIEDRIVRISYAEGPRAPAAPYVAERPGLSRGKVATFNVRSRQSGNERKVSVYTSPGRESGCPECSLLLLFDRASYLTAVPTPTILDNLLDDGAIGPLVAVLVGNTERPGRSQELPPNPAFQAFLREELLPWARERYRFTSDPRCSVVAGSSFGGLAAAYTALTMPERFGNVLSQSGSYWWWPGYRSDMRLEDVLGPDSGWLVTRFASAGAHELRFYMDAGEWEGEVILLPNRMFRDVLSAKGYEVTYHEYVGGHDYVAWRQTFAEGLKTFIGSDGTSECRARD